MRTRLIVAGCVLLLAACSGSDGNGASEEPQAIPAETSVTTTTIAPTTTTAPNGLGVTQTNEYEEPGEEGGTYAAKITVFRYRDARALEPDVESELNSNGKRTVAIEVRVCITKAPPGKEGESYVSWEPWSLGDDQGASYEELTTYSGEITALPVYPNDKITPVGTCRRGWVPFEVPRNYKPDFVEYNSGFGDVLKWPIKK
jgi:hypothetical protein